jgi:hypothetical protein
MMRKFYARAARDARSIPLALVLLTTLIASSCAHRPAAPARAVLWVGTIETLGGGVPELLRAQAQRAGQPIALDTLPSDADLARRVRDGSLQAVLAQKRYALVIIEDRQGYPLCSVRDPDCATSSQAIVDAAALIRGTGARPLWLSTWHAYPPVQFELSRRAQQLASVAALDVADVGGAMIRYKREGGRNGLLGDRERLSAAGEWLAAAVAWRGIVQTAALDADAPALNCPDAALPDCARLSDEDRRALEVAAGLREPPG